MKLGLVFSNDWELFGDGSGDYFAIQHRPLEELVKICEDGGAKLTVMAEIGQQLAHQKIAETQGWAREIVEGWESILQKTVRSGSDVQLHLHPQWLGAEYKNNKWNVDLTKWAVSSVQPEEMEEVLTKGKTYLESLLQPVDSGYECIAFRAGAYCIQPSAVVIEKLLKVGIVCDTSVVCGMYNPPFYDYRDAYSNVLPWYACASNIKYRGQNENGLLEVPVCSYSGIDIPIVRRYLSRDVADLVCFGTRMSEEDREWLRERERLIGERYPPAGRPFQDNSVSNRPVSERIRWLIGKVFGSNVAVTLDYDKLPSKIFVKCLQKIYEGETVRHLRNTDVIIPLMVSGHVKHMHSCENIKRILDDIRTSLKEKMVFWTLRDAIRYWINLNRTDLAVHEECISTTSSR